MTWPALLTLAGGPQRGANLGRLGIIPDGAVLVRGDTIELFPSHLDDRAWRISLFGDEVETITEFDPLNDVLDNSVGGQVQLVRTADQRSLLTLHASGLRTADIHSEGTKKVGTREMGDAVVAAITTTKKITKS